MKAQPEIEFLAALGIHIGEDNTGKWCGLDVRYLSQLESFVESNHE